MGAPQCMNVLLTWKRIDFPSYVTQRQYIHGWDFSPLGAFRWVSDQRLAAPGCAASLLVECLSSLFPTFGRQFSATIGKPHLVPFLGKMYWWYPASWNIREGGVERPGTVILCWLTVTAMESFLFTVKVRLCCHLRILE